METAAEFTALFNELDEYLRGALHIDKPWDFMNLVNEAVRRGLVHRSVAADLHDCKNLRNLLVHTARYPHEAYAEPSAWGLQHFREIVEEIVHPLRLVPTFQRDLRVFDPGRPLAEALAYMDQKDYSQVVVRVEGGRHVLLTLEGVARWLAGATAGGVAPVGAAAVADALRYEPQGTCAYMAGDATLVEARKTFELPRHSQKRARVFAVIISEHGTEGERPLGIVTAGDLIDDAAG